MFDSSKIWTLNKEELLKRVSLSEIISYYLPGKGSKYKLLCPFHKDSRPSLHVDALRGKFVCYACGKKGDAIQYIVERYNVNFIEGLRIISNDLGLFSHNYDKRVAPEILGLSKASKPCEIKIKIKPWDKESFNYWHKLNINDDKGQTLKELKESKIFSISHYWINDRIFEIKDKFAFAYIIDDRIQIYKPLSKEYKWFSSLRKSDIFGLSNLNYNNDFLIITKSRKDTTCMRLMGLSVIAPIAESILIEKDVMAYLKTKFKRIYTLFDYDNSGIHLSWEMRKLYGTIPLFFAEKTWGRKLGYKGCKDVSEFIVSNKEELLKIKNKYEKI